MKYKVFIQDQLINRGITNQKILDAFQIIPRELFVPEYLKERAYEDAALPIGFGQTISQPFTVAFMTRLLEPKEDQTILEIGTGSGYQAAILSKLVKKVYTIEIIKELHKNALRILEVLKLRNIEALNGNGYKGLPDKAPFDGIIVTAGASLVPKELLNQLTDGGKLVIPVGEGDIKTMTRFTKSGPECKKEEFGEFTFVPLVNPTDNTTV